MRDHCSVFSLDQMAHVLGCIIFATIVQITDKTKECLSMDTCLAMLFNLAKSAEKN